MAAPENEEIIELKQKLKRRETWFERLQCDYRELAAEAEQLREENARLTKELNDSHGDTMKLQARIAELEAKLPPEPGIIIP